MSKKQDAIYFDNFIECAGFASKAALMLKDISAALTPPGCPSGWTRSTRSSTRPTSAATA